MAAAEAGPRAISLRELVRRRLRGRLVLRPHGLPNLLAVDRDGLRRLDPDAHLVADDLHHLDGDVLAEHDLLAGATGDDQHPARLPVRRPAAAPARTAARARARRRPR